MVALVAGLSPEARGLSLGEVEMLLHEFGHALNSLLSRTESKLTAAASEIEAKYNVQTKVVAVDFGAATAADYGRIAGVIGDLDVAVLVNNVGMSYDHAEYYDAIDDKLIDDLIAINIQATNKVS